MQTSTTQTPKLQTLIIFATKHGATKRYAEELASTLPGETKLVDLSKDAIPAIDGFDTVVIGSCIYGGQAQKQVKDFCAGNMEILRRKRLGLFICCWHEGAEAEKQLADAFPAELRDSAKIKMILGGEMNLERMHFLERFAVKMVAKVKESASHYSVQSVEQFAQALQA